MPPPTLYKDLDFSTLGDEELMHWVVKKEQEAFAVLVRRYSKRFYAFCYRFLWNREEAEEAVQEAFFKLWSKASQWQPTMQTKFTTWFFRIMTHHCLDLKKKKKPALFDQQSDVEDVTDESDLEPNREEERQALLQAMQQLTEHQMMALNLCFFEGLTNQEAAQIMNINLKALQSLLMRGKEMLRRQISVGMKP